MSKTGTQDEINPHTYTPLLQQMALQVSSYIA